MQGHWACDTTVVLDEASESEACDVETSLEVLHIGRIGMFCLTNRYASLQDLHDIQT